MSILQSIILGIVQGATEFLPVSSSGHLAILKYIFGVSEAGVAYDMLLHLGTLIAVFVVYYKDIWNVIVNVIRIAVCICHNIKVLCINLFGRPEEKLPYSKVIDSPYKRFIVLLIISTIPSGVFGFTMQSWVDEISQGLLVPGICLLITGVVLLLSRTFPEGRKNAKTMTYRDALYVGLAQVCSIFPGISRSGSTLSVCRMRGLGNVYAVKYSFLMSIPVIMGSALSAFLDFDVNEISGNEIWIYLAGMACAAVVGFVCIRWLLSLIRKKSFRFFALYCFAVGIFAVTASFIIK